MFIYNTREIEDIRVDRAEMGEPSIVITKGGRMFVSYQTADAAFAISSDDDGRSWSAPRAAAVAQQGESVFCSRLWVDPLGRLWFIWSTIKNNRVECAICADPDADTLEWGEVRRLDLGLLLARPITLESGAWLFVSGVTNREIAARAQGESGKEKGIYVHVSLDEGETFTKINKTVANNTTFDALSATEKVILSRPNGVDIEKKYFVAVYAQVSYGIAKFVSPDGGIGFRAESDSTFGSYDSQFDVSTIGPIVDKKFLLVNNMHFAEGGKMCLCAMHSNSRGDSYQGVLELESSDVKAYSPDIAINGDAMLVVYARDNAEGKREIALARFTEQDVLSYDIKDADSYIGRVIC